MAKDNEEKIDPNIRPRRGGLPAGAKRCPFLSAFEDVACGPDCALFREKKTAGFHCPLTELTSISWLLNGKPKKY